MQTHAKRYTSHTDSPLRPTDLPVAKLEVTGRNSFLHSKESASLQCSVDRPKFLAIQLIAKNGLRNKAVFCCLVEKPERPLLSSATFKRIYSLQGAT